MSRTRFGVLGGAVLAGGLLLGLSGGALAQSPSAPPSSAPVGTTSWNGAGIMGGYGAGGMMGGYGATASGSPQNIGGPPESGLPSLMNGNGLGHMDGANIQQMLTWMKQAGPQFQAMHDAMAKSGCSTETMKRFLAPPARAS